MGGGFTTNREFTVHAWSCQWIMPGNFFSHLNSYKQKNDIFVNNRKCWKGQQIQSELLTAHSTLKRVISLPKNVYDIISVLVGVLKRSIIDLIRNMSYRLISLQLELIRIHPKTDRNINKHFIVNTITWFNYQTFFERMEDKTNQLQPDIYQHIKLIII